MKIKISADGKTVVSLYDDNLSGLAKHGHTVITRASNVEPAAMGGWEARMVDGTVLGPYPLRAAALTAEREYLEARF